MGEHKKATEKGKWDHSGITQHKQNCHLPVDWDKPEALTTTANKNKRKLNFDLKIEVKEKEEEVRSFSS
jgi:hypothetical protein